MSLPTSANVDRPKALGYGARIDDLWLRLAVAPGRELKIDTAPLQAPKISTAEVPEEFRSEFGEPFSRAAFYGGEGLGFAHGRGTTEEDAARYFDSKGIDIRRSRPGEIDAAKLLRSVSRIDTAGEGAQAYDGTAHYVAAGTTIRRSVDPLVTTPTYANESPHVAEGATTVEDLVGVGSVVYAALGANGIHRRVAGAWAHWSDLQATKVWATMSTSSGALILAALDNVLYEARAAGASVTLVTLGTGETWIDVAQAGSAILAAASNGRVYALGLNDAGTALELKGETRVSDSGQVNCIGFAGGFVFYGLRESTGSGAVGSWWRATLNPTSNALEGAQVLRRWTHEGDSDHAVDHSPRRIYTSEDEVLVGVIEHDRNAFLWRYDLETAGRSRYLDSGTAAGVVNDILVIGDRAFFTVAGGGTYREATTYAASGYLIGPLGDLFSAAEKPWVGAFIDHETIQSDSRIELYATTDPAALADPAHSSWRLVSTISSGRTENEIQVSGLEGRYIAGMVKLYASTGATVTPAVRSFTFRAYPSEVDIVVEMPVVVGDVIERPNMRRQRIRGHGTLVYAALAAKEAKAATLYLPDLDENIRGIVKNVARPVSVMSERGFPLLVAFVTVQGRRAATPNAGTGDGILGIGIIGIATIGGTS